MLSYASKGLNPIAMMSNNSRVILHSILTSLTLCCLVMTLPISLYYSSVVNKHQLLALSVFVYIVELIPRMLYIVGICVNNL